MLKRRARRSITRTQSEVSNAHSLKMDLVESLNPLPSSRFARTQARKEAFRKTGSPSDLGKSGIGLYSNDERHRNGEKG